MKEAISSERFEVHIVPDLVTIAMLFYYAIFHY